MKSKPNGRVGTKTKLKSKSKAKKKVDRYAAATAMLIAEAAAAEEATAKKQLKLKLKDSTRAMVDRGSCNHRLPRHYREYYAKFARKLRKGGLSNMWIMQIQGARQYKVNYLKETRGFRELADHGQGYPRPDPDPPPDLPVAQEQSEDLDSAAARPRRPRRRVVPTRDQLALCFE